MCRASTYRTSVAGSPPGFEDSRLSTRRPTRRPPRRCGRVPPGRVRGRGPVGVAPPSRRRAAFGLNYRIRGHARPRQGLDPPAERLDDTGTQTPTRRRSCRPMDDSLWQPMSGRSPRPPGSLARGNSMDSMTNDFWDVLLWSFWFFIWIAALMVWFRCIFDLFGDQLAQRLGQGRLGDPAHLRAVARRADLPDRPRPQHDRAADGGGHRRQQAEQEKYIRQVAGTRPPGGRPDRQRQGAARLRSHHPGRVRRAQGQGARLIRGIRGGRQQRRSSSETPLLTLDRVVGPATTRGRLARPPPGRLPAGRPQRATLHAAGA